MANLLRDSGDVLLHTGPGLLSGTDLPVEDLAEAVWGEAGGRFSLDRFESDPGGLWADWVEFWHDAPVDPADVSPRPVHERVAELVGSDHVSWVLTENIYGLLREAGVPAERCIEFHGRVDRARCAFCGRTYEAAPAEASAHRRCVAPMCGGSLGPGVVLAEEPPDRADRLLAWSHAEECDVYLAAGTRLAVHPTAENAEHALETGSDLVVVGERPTPFDGAATCRVSADPAGALARLRDALAILG